MIVQFTHRAPEGFLHDDERAVLTEARKLCDVNGLVSIGPAKMGTLTGLSKRKAQEALWELVAKAFLTIDRPAMTGDCLKPPRYHVTGFALTNGPKVIPFGRQSSSRPEMAKLKRKA